MSDIFSILNFVALCGIVGAIYYFRSYFINQTSEETIVRSVLSAFVSFATLDELAEHREAVTAGIQPFFAEAMVGVVEEFQTMMTKMLPSEEEIQQATEQMTETLSQEVITNQVNPELQPIVKKLFAKDGQFAENPMMELIMTFLLPKLGGKPTEPTRGTIEKGGW